MICVCGHKQEFHRGLKEDCYAGIEICRCIKFREDVETQKEKYIETSDISDGNGYSVFQKWKQSPDGKVTLMEEKIVKPTQFRVGDTVFCMGLYGEVEAINCDGKYVKVIFHKGNPDAYIQYFKQDGNMCEHLIPKLSLISRPKKMVKKQVSCWVNIYAGNKQGDNFYTKDEADEYELANRRIPYDRLACVELKGEYEIEEE